ncbi:MAG: hypothetical protein AAFO81_15255 [Pseudomonadota bacterium]
MNDKHYEKWKTIRAKGKFHYVLFGGVIRFGLLIGVGLWLGGLPFDENLLSNRLPITLGVCLVVGLFFGITMWSLNERLFKLHSEASFEE